MREDYDSVSSAERKVTGGGVGGPAVTAFDSKSASESLKENPDDVLSTSPHSKSHAASTAAAPSIKARCSEVTIACVSGRQAPAVDSRADISSCGACRVRVGMDGDNRRSHFLIAAGKAKREEGRGGGGRVGVTVTAPQELTID